MVDDNELKRLRRTSGAGSRRRGEGPRACRRHAGVRREKYFTRPPKDRQGRLRLTDRAQKLWREMMQKKLLRHAGAGRARRAADRRLRHLLPDGGIAVQFRRRTRSRMARWCARTRRPPNPPRTRRPSAEIRDDYAASTQPEPRAAEAPADYAAPEAELSRDVSGLAAPAPAERRAAASAQFRSAVAASKMMADQSAGIRSRRHPAAGRRKPRPLRGVQDQSGALGAGPTRSRPSRSMSTRRPIPSCAAR